MDEYKHLLFNPKLTETDLVTNAGTCLLCRPGLCITISHGKDHKKKSKRIDGMVLNGCRKDTSFCHVEENKPTRYHYHCPICLYNNKEVGRLFLHINKCKSHPTLNRGCSRDRPTTSPVKDGNATTPDIGQQEQPKSPAEDGSVTGVHKPTTSRAKDGSATTPDIGQQEQPKSPAEDGSATGVHKPTSTTSSTAPDNKSLCDICNKMYPASYLARHKLILVKKRGQAC